MTLLKIAQIGNPVLLAAAEKVQNANSSRIQQLIDDMIETMEDARGVGLAAPQIYQSLRLFVAKRADLGEKMDESPPFVMINPILEPLGEECSIAVEGCLSIPGLRGFVERPERVRYSGFDRFGVAIEGEACGFFARILQHEYDHLDGVMFPERLHSWSHIAVDAEVGRLDEYLQACEEEPDATHDPAVGAS